MLSSGIVAIWGCHLLCLLVLSLSFYYINENLIHSIMCLVRIWFFRWYGMEYFETGLWIRIRIGSGFNDFVDPYSESGSRIQGSIFGIRIQGKEGKNCTFSDIFFNFITKAFCGCGSALDPDSNCAGSGSVLNQSGSTTLFWNIPVLFPLSKSCYRIVFV
jgi:hypothetical protein